MDRLIIIGASGHGKVVADIARLQGYNEIVFLDDDNTIESCEGYPVVGNTDMDIEGEVFVAIGDWKTRSLLMEKRNVVTLIHPSAVIAKDVKIGTGTVVMAGAVINPGTTIGRGCIINTCASVDHDCYLADYVHVSVGAHLSGNVNVGSGTWIGAGAVAVNNISICKNSVIGAGAVVIGNINEEGTYVGVPARKIMKGEIK